MSTPDDAHSGIEVHVSNTGTVEAIAKALHALHLDGVNKYMAKNTVAVIMLDGQEIRQKLFTEHFVPCAPGVHTVGFFFWDFSGLTAGGEAYQAMLNEATAEVTVEPGKVTLLDYRMRSATVLRASLTVTGTRDA
jgi:hypothetical protein